MPLVLAGPVQPGQEEFFASEVEPQLDGEPVRYIGEVGEEKGELYAGARALPHADPLAEPFGLVMTEAMACGTPVIAFPEGSAPEIVLDGETGFVVDDEHEMAPPWPGSARSTRSAAATARASASTSPPSPRRTTSASRRAVDRAAHPYVDLSPRRGYLPGPWRTSTARAAG